MCCDRVVDFSLNNRRDCAEDDNSSLSDAVDLDEVATEAATSSTDSYTPVLRRIDADSGKTLIGLSEERLSFSQRCSH